MSRNATGSYRCDCCKANLSLRENGSNDHLSITFGPTTGIATLVGALTGWRVYRKIRPDRYHFCNSSHMKEWFDAVIQLHESEQP